MHRKPSDWKNIVPSAVLAGSEAQRLNVMSMMRDDIISLGRTLECIMEAAELGDIDACHEAARQALTLCDLMQPISK
ncbi:MAG: hypothetical protein E6Q97_05480 [Desulfurellales bacterium]|nr:MAG: hypothetical protein E6Q97_05480 [Desulfurellales bacterium]